MKAKGRRPPSEAAGVAGDIHQKLERAGIGVADAVGQTHGGLDDLIAQILGKVRRRCDLDDLLEVPLHAALTLAEVSDPAAFIAENLHLDMACSTDELFDVEIAVAERGLRFGTAALEGRGHRVGAVDHPRSAAAATTDGFDHHGARTTELVEERGGLFHGHGVVEAADDGHTGSRCGFACACLVTEQLQCLDTRTDERQPRLGTSCCEACVLGEETVTGMDGITAVGLGDRNDLLDVEISSRADTFQGNRLVGLAGMQRSGIILRIDRHRRDVQLRCRPDDPDGNLTSVRYQ